MILIWIVPIIEVHTGRKMMNQIHQKHNTNPLQRDKKNKNNKITKNNKRNDLNIRFILENNKSEEHITKFISKMVDNV